MLLLGREVFNRRVTHGIDQVFRAFRSSSGIRHQQAFLIPLIHHFHKLPVRVGFKHIHYSGAALVDIFQNTQAVPETGAQIVKGKSFLHTAASPGRYQRVHIRMGFLHLEVCFVDVVPSLQGRSVNVQFIQNSAADGHAVATGPHIDGGNGVELPIHHASGHHLFPDSRRGVLAVLLHQVVNGCGHAVVNQGAQAA